MSSIHSDDPLSEFFDFNGASQLDFPLDSSLVDNTTADTAHAVNGSPVVEESTLYPDILAEFGVQPGTSDDPGDFANFAKWIPRFSKPELPCAYCAPRRLECWFTYAGQTSCSACNALFRQCSFSDDGPQAKTGMMSTLHVLQEDTVQSCGGMTGLVALKSWDRSVDQPQGDIERGRKHVARFSRAAVKMLKEWMDEHPEHPYPTEGEKEQLKTRTGLTSTQISNWLANTRRRTKARVSRGVSPSIRSPIYSSTSAAIDVKARAVLGPANKEWEIMNPLERWQESPPENEPASMTAIANAVAISRFSNESSLSNSHQSRQLESSAGSGSLRHGAPSITSLGTGQSDSVLSSESFSNISMGSSRSHGSLQSLRSLGSRKDRHRRRRTTANPSGAKVSPEARPFQCTFCTDTFKTKYDWMRHEKSLHLSLEKWICAPLGPILSISHEGNQECVYCGEPNPHPDHLESHSHKMCVEKGIEGRTFYRKDHLNQHLRLVHGCKVNAKLMNSWKSEITYIKSRCGFCGEVFSTWSDRCDHLSKHFRMGVKMSDWKGCHGFDAVVAAKVTHAMPPYLIGQESQSLDPFSASTRDTSSNSSLTPMSNEILTRDGFGSLCGSKMEAERAGPHQAFGESPMGSARTWWNFADEVTNVPGVVPQMQTCWEILTIRLGLFARAKMERGIIVTDEMLQVQARRILFESDDPWNQTAADNPEWLTFFKKAHGLLPPPSSEEVNIIEDLSLRIGEFYTSQ